MISAKCSIQAGYQKTTTKYQLVNLILKEGQDITILTVGATLYQALEAAKILEEKIWLIR